MDIKDIAGKVIYSSTKVKTVLDLIKEALQISTDLPQANLPGVDLQGLSSGEHRALRMPGANLTGANFSMAMLPGSDFAGANMSQANFFAARMRNANFANANLTGANFIKADLTNANFENANLMGANFTNCILQNANMNGAIK